MDSFKSWTKNEELKSWARDTVASIENCAERMKDKRLSDKDRDSFGVMLVQLSQAIKHDAEYSNNLAMRDMSSWLLDAFDALINNDVAAFEAKYEVLRQLSFFGEVLISEEERASWAAEDREDGRTYIDFIPSTLTNEQSNQIVEHLQSIGAKFDPEVGQWYVEVDWKMPELSQNEQKNNQEQKKENEIMDENQTNVTNETQYKAIYYDGKERKEVFADTKENVFQAVQEAKTDRKETDRCYIQEWDAASENYKQEGIYLIKSGRDVTPIEIKVPHLASEAFNEVKDYIKEMGAKFDVSKKMWYMERSESQTTMDMIQSYIDSKTPYKAVYYDGKERKEVFADTKENALQAVQEVKPERKETDRCYIQEREESGAYKQEGIYLIESGRDVTPVELKRPYISQETYSEIKQEFKEMGAKFDGDKKVWYAERSLGEDAIKQLQDFLDKHDEGIYLNLPKTKTPEEFKAQVEQLKQDGARYNPDKKAWYITEKTDRSKFADYLPAEKTSIHAKLEQNRKTAEQNEQGKDRSIEPKNKDNHERA